MNSLIYNYRFVVNGIVSVSVISRIGLAIQRMDILGPQKQMMIEHRNSDNVDLKSSVHSVSGKEGTMVPPAGVTSLTGASHNENRSCSNSISGLPRIDSTSSTYITGESPVLPQSLISSRASSTGMIPSLANVTQKRFFKIRGEVSCVDHYIRKNERDTIQVEFPLSAGDFSRFTSELITFYSGYSSLVIIDHWIKYFLPNLRKSPLEWNCKNQGTESDEYGSLYQLCSGEVALNREFTDMEGQFVIHFLKSDRVKIFLAVGLKVIDILNSCMGRHVVVPMTNHGFGMSVVGTDHQHKLLVSILHVVGFKIDSDVLNGVFAKWYGGKVRDGRQINCMVWEAYHFTSTDGVGFHVDEIIETFLQASQSVLLSGKDDLLNVYYRLLRQAFCGKILSNQCILAPFLSSFVVSLLLLTVLPLVSIYRLKCKLDLSQVSYDMSFLRHYF